MSRSAEAAPATVQGLWRQFLPLSLSDVTMMASDPLVTTTLAHLPDARMNLAAVGVAKSLAVFFEAPVIMMLHASTALAASYRARSALWRFMLVAIAMLTGAMLALAVPTIFERAAGRVLGVSGELGERARQVLVLMVLWPAAIGWRRYFQGLLIHGGHSSAVGRAGLLRIAFVACALALGFSSGMAGARLAALTLVGGVIVEASAVTIAAVSRGVASGASTESGPSDLPGDLAGVWRFYWPLATSMLVVWGGRALLVGIVARAVDGPAALAAWPAAWALVLLVANATRMVQQVVIKNRKAVPASTLWAFVLSVGAVCTASLLVVGATPWGARLVIAFVGGDPELVARVKPVVLVCALVPFLVAVQNAAQGFLIAAGRTARVNGATWLGTALLLAVSWAAVSGGCAGALAAAVAMLAALCIEIAVLLTGLAPVPPDQRDLLARA